MHGDFKSSLESALHKFGCSVRRGQTWNSEHLFCSASRKKLRKLTRTKSLDYDIRSDSKVDFRILRHIR
jgi:hypothetical protein